ncbi:MAG: DHH family phosphoesterase [bacterium]
MALNSIEQSIELIKKSQYILITFRKNWTGDAFASALALGRIFKKIGKNADIICQDFEPNTHLSFLPTGEVQKQIKSLQKFIISISTGKTQVGEFTYNKEENKLNIFITPKNGQFNKEDVSVSHSAYKYDLIIVLDTPDLDSLGELFERHSDFFYNTPKINIDHSSQNESFGNVNLMDLTAASTAEIVYDLIRKVDENLIDEEVATYLLAGVILSTKNFKTIKVTPKTLNTASELIQKNARRNQIIQALYQNRFMSTLKMWGRVLSKLNTDPDNKLAWSVLSYADFTETETAPSEIIEVIDELIVSMPKVNTILIIYEVKNGDKMAVECLIYTNKAVDSMFVAKKFNPVGDPDLAKFKLEDVSLSEAEKIITDEIKTKLII